MHSKRSLINEFELDTSDATKLILVQRIDSYLENKSQEYKHNNLLRDCIKSHFYKTQTDQT